MFNTLLSANQIERRQMPDIATFCRTRDSWTQTGQWVSESLWASPSSQTWTPRIATSSRASVSLSFKFSTKWMKLRKKRGEDYNGTISNCVLKEPCRTLSIATNPSFLTFPSLVIIISVSFSIFICYLDILRANYCIRSNWITNTTG